MREVTVRIQFTTPCLGNDKKYRTIRIGGTAKKRTFFLFSRTPDGKVILMPQWWQALLRDAALVMGRFHKEVKNITFALEVDGSPQPVPDKFHKRYYDNDKFSPHEAFATGDIIGVSCLVPPDIDDEEFWQLMTTAGKYYGISPAHSKEFGRFKVVNIERRGPQTDKSQAPPLDAQTREESNEMVT